MGARLRNSVTSADRLIEYAEAGFADDSPANLAASAIADDENSIHHM
ncbi:hypothetical protein [Rhizobium sp. KDH_Rht_773_N]